MTSFSKLFTISLLLLCGNQVVAQCNAAADAGEPIVICPDASGAGLAGTVDLVGGELLSVEWSPATAVTSADQVMTTFTGDETTTMTFSASVIYSDNNLLVNGDFESPGMVWTTEYEPGPGGAFGPLSAEGTYVVDVNASNTHSNFAACDDHTGGGQMLVVNGATQPNEEIYCQEVTVDPNTDYALRAWVQSVISENPARLQFSVNGQLIGNLFRPSSSVCNWGQFDDRWNSGTATTARMCIVNQNTQSSGNDFAIDDLYFGPICEVTDDVLVTVVEAEIELDDEFTLPCNIPSGGTELDATGTTTGANYSYLWTTDANGNIVSGATTLTPSVDQPGNYTLTLSYDDGTTVCTESATILVRANPNIPSAVANEDGILTCSNDRVTLSAAGSSSGSSVSYFWEATVGGNIVGSTSGLTVQVDQPGTYTLTVVGFMGCTATRTVEVLQDLSTPIMSIEPVGNISCDQPEVIIDGGASEVGSNITSSWVASNGGTFVTGQNGYTPTVSSAGTYTFRLTNTDTGCFTEQDVIVTETAGEVTAQANATGEINCDGTGLAMLSGVGSTTGTGISYQWTSTDGSFSGPTNGLMATATSAGTYVLTVTSAGGCTNSTFTTVTSTDFDVPITLTSPLPFTCDRAQININADVMTSDPITYQWSTADGNIVQGGDSANPLIDQPGTYVLTVTNTITNCTASEAITIDPVAGLPVANANEDLRLTCTTTQVFLNATGSSTGPEFTSVYQDADENVLPTIAITEAGLYRLIVTNTDTDCQAIDTVMVFADTIAPNAPINTPGLEITCDRPELLIGTDQFGLGYTFQWSTPDGTFSGLPTAPSIAVEGPGTYTLVTTDPSNGCTDESTVTITVNNAIPDLNIADVSIIDCQNPTQELMATDVGTGSFEYVWTTTGGNILQDGNTLTPLIAAGGDYQLIATNPGTGCADTLNVVVDENGAPPPAAITGDDLLTCDLPQVDLSAAGVIPGDSITYTWSTTDGTLASDPVATSAAATGPGTYLLTVVNINSGCQSVASVTLLQDITAPENSLDQNSYALTCNTNSVILEGLTTPVSGLEYTWTAPAGNTQQTSATSQLLADVTGDFTLSVRNPVNGCVTERTVPVVVDRAVNAVSLTTSGQINCRDAQIDLLGSVADPAGDFFPRFIDASGNPVSATDLTASVSTIGRYGLIVTNSVNGCMDTAYVDVTESFTPPVANAGSPFMLNCRNPEIALDGTGSTPGDTIVYAWSSVTGNIVSGAGTAAPTVDAAGQYRLVVLNTVNGCSADDAVVITENFSAPTVDMALSQVLSCGQPEQTLVPMTGSTVGTDYAWFEGNVNGTPVVTTPDLTVAEAGTYVLVATSRNTGCETTRTVTVTEDKTIPVASITGPDELNCTRTSLALEGQSAAGNATFAWSTTDGVVTGDPRATQIDLSVPGTYQLITLNPDNGCTDTVRTIVAIDTMAPEVRLMPVLQLNCANPTTELVPDPADRLPGFRYDWTTTDGNVVGQVNQPEATVNLAGTYALEVTNPTNGCTQDLVVTVTQDTVKPGLQEPAPATLTCSQTMFTVTTGNPEPNVMYQWTSTDGTLEGPAISPDLSVSTPGTYVLTATNNLNACESAITWRVTEDVATPTVGLPAEIDLGCDPMPTGITAEVSTGDLNYTWRTGDGAILGASDSTAVTVDGAGIYVFTATNPANDCEASATIRVLENTLDSVLFDLSPITCETETARLQFNDAVGGVGPYLFSADGGMTYGTGISPRSLEPGTYELRAQDSRGCEVFDSITVDSFRNLQIDLPRSVTYAIGDSTALDLQTNFVLSDLDTIIWTPTRDLSCTDCLNPVASPSRTTTYDVLVRSVDGCTAMALINVQVDERLGVYFPTGFSPNGDGQNDRFHPFGDVDRVLSVSDFRIHDRWGNAVFEAEELPLNDPMSGWDGTFRGREVNPAVYVYSAVVVFLNGREVLVEGEVVVVR
ncbi:gliding motility-associated C-terminal domain-containing protein [Lewinella sp. 4G2]|uniref:T9SS type B sorting domain-containing protein n=1 Tax=Lewinella sp. 4G2 TaxID=1803372 RepID=UPI0007B45DDD|nr:gliding motility-associated C-terminal domain-containing protein [Lewinella sp. 4G2]OAV42651.1 hypothetical protein A3850_015510 [Lewinella sp. 4G2]